ncbi:MAG: acyl-CoA dehydrogenase family protein [Enhydrobacter sp.]|nr:acyl-CoA dehydrogenase family protein [Enhydrobacter sp.]
MSESAVIMSMPRKQRSAAEIAREIGPEIGRLSDAAQDEDTYVAESFALLKQAGLLEVGVPAELGGGGAGPDELAEMLKTLGWYCGSTALAFAMHTHQVAVPAWRWRHQPAARPAVEPLLKRLAVERLQLVSSGASDWISGEGKAEKVEGGYRITARKRFASGAPTGDLLVTGAVLEEPGEPPMVLHFALPMKSPQVKVQSNWHTLGMRGTGSHDVEVDGHVVPEAAVSLKRKSGEWHPLFQIISTIAFPLVYAAYLGVAERARHIALGIARRKPDRHMVQIAGRMESEFMAARLAHAHMLATVRLDAPSAQTVNDIMTARQLVGRHAIATVEQAMELAGGAGFYRDAGLERRFRDIQGARYHVMRTAQQQDYAGSMALGLPVDKVY